MLNQFYELRPGEIWKHHPREPKEVLDELGPKQPRTKWLVWISATVYDDKKKQAVA
jgi:hypothetical protein